MTEIPYQQGLNAEIKIGERGGGGCESASPTHKKMGYQIDDPDEPWMDDYHGIDGDEDPTEGDTNESQV